MSVFPLEYSSAHNVQSGRIGSPWWDKNAMLQATETAETGFRQSVAP